MAQFDLVVASGRGMGSFPGLLPSRTASTSLTLAGVCILGLLVPRGKTVRLRTSVATAAGTATTTAIASPHLHGAREGA